MIIYLNNIIIYNNWQVLSKSMKLYFIKEKNQKTTKEDISKYTYGCLGFYQMKIIIIIIIENHYFCLPWKIEIKILYNK